METRARLSLGAEVIEEGVFYRIWAPELERVEVEIAEGGIVAASGAASAESFRVVVLNRDEAGYFQGIDCAGRHGDRYKYRLNGGALFPDPASRWQPDGVHGDSCVLERSRYVWRNPEWQCPKVRDLVIYELHIGTFTPAGTYSAAVHRLPFLKELGVNAIQLMPVAAFPGLRNWGYDGVGLYAPAACLGHPDELRALVDAAHGHGIAVVLDVVYNHLGPDGNYLAEFSRFYFNQKHQTPWGAALNFDGEENGPVRLYFKSNALYWLEQFHFDGIRLDATHAIVDESPRHILQEIAGAVHAHGGFVFAEDERNLARLVEPSPDGYSLDAVYADDFCHSVHVALGDRAYRDDFDGSPEEIAAELEHGWLYRGQVSRRQGVRRGTESSHLRPERFIFCISNHDQVGNRAFGERLSHWVSPEAYRAASALLLLSPFTPLLFMGQEWAASTPFLYFTDHNPQLGALVREGRRKEFEHLADFSDPERQHEIPDPQSEQTFSSSKLRWDELTAPGHSGVLALYRECLRLRKTDPMFRPAERGRWRVASGGVVMLRLKGGESHPGKSHEWLLVVDLVGGHRLSLSADGFCLAPERAWTHVLSTNESRFGGAGLHPSEGPVDEVVFHQPEMLVFQSRPL